jgi:hypothetical protein
MKEIGSEFFETNPQREINEGEINRKALSADYDNIRKMAIAMLQQRVLLLQDSSESNSPEVAKLQEAMAHLQDNSFILSAAKINNWQDIRDNSENLEETDENLAKGLIQTASMES